MISSNLENQMRMAETILKREFGSNWKTIVQTLGTQELTNCVGRDFTSFIAFPERGEGSGSNKWRGNCSPKVIEKVLDFCLDTYKYERKNKNQFVFTDCMSGSGTSYAVGQSRGVKTYLYDLNPNPAYGIGGWNALTCNLDTDSDLIFIHPPYHNIIKYSGNMWGNMPDPNDLSQCSSYSEFIDKWNYIVEKSFFSLRKGGTLAVLVGDIRKNGVFHSIANDMMTIGTCISWVVKGQFNTVSSNRSYSNCKPYIPITTEYLLLFRKEDCIMIPFSKRVYGTFDLKKNDSNTLTWLHLLRSLFEVYGSMPLSKLYQLIENHPKALRNMHFRERIRATIYEHPETFIKCNNDCYKLSYIA